MEREEGKMTSQERFWQARLLSKEAEHRAELSAIHRQLEALKATTDDAKADLEHQQLQPQPGTLSASKQSKPVSCEAANDDINEDNCTEMNKESQISDDKEEHIAYEQAPLLPPRPASEPPPAQNEYASIL